VKYLLDSNTYIQAKNQYYGMGFCPAYWDWLDACFEAGEVCSIEFIGSEMQSGNDDLAAWVKARPAHFLPHDDEMTQTVYADIVNFVMSQNFDAAPRDFFLTKGDPWLIAKAKVLGASVVTNEATVAPEFALLREMLRARQSAGVSRPGLCPPAPAPAPLPPAPTCRSSRRAAHSRCPRK